MSISRLIKVLPLRVKGALVRGAQVDYDPTNTGFTTLLKYAAGDPITGSFARSGVATYFDTNGILQTAGDGVARDGHYQSGNRTLLLEISRTNVVLQNRDLSNAAWTKSNVTATKDQTGIDGSANTASSITATAGNGTVLQAITLASSARFQTAYVKRLVGTGTINMTMDNGSTWTAITVTGAYTRVSIPTQTLANPTVGFQIVTSGDSIAVDYVQNENGTFATSPIATAGSAVQRNADTLTYVVGWLPQALTWYTDFYDISVLLGTSLGQLGSSAISGEYVLIDGNGNNQYRAIHGAGGNGSSTGQDSGTANALDRVELRAVVDGTGVIQLGKSVNGGAEASGAAGAAAAFNSAYGHAMLTIGAQDGGGSGSCIAIRKFVFGSGAVTQGDMRAA